MQEINFSKPKLHLFVCVNDRTTKPSCNQYIFEENYKEVKRWIIEKGWSSIVYCTKTGCLGFCPSENNPGGVAVIYPSGRFVKNIHNVDEIKHLVIEELDQINKF